MAEYLIGEKYVHPAAVIIGSVLEEHVRQLCRASGLSLEQPVASGGTRPKTSHALNSELAKTNIYSVLDQKMVTAWLDLRNKAAHGRYTDYTPEQVSNMLSGVTEFVARTRP